LCLRNTVEHLEAMLACYQLGAVPINVNWRYSAEELAYLFADAETVLVVHGAEFTAAVRGASKRTPGVRDTFVGEGAAFEALVATAGAADAFAPRSGDDHYILYPG